MVTKVRTVKNLRAVLVAASAIAVGAAGALGQVPNTDWYTSNPDATSFVISTADELAGLAQLVNAGNTFDERTVTLGNDIDLSVHYGESYNGGKGWTPIGDTSIVSFNGIFDGKGKVIRGLYIYDTTSYIAGLFGYTNGNTVVKNIGIEIATIFCDGGIVGSIVGSAQGSSLTITNSYSIGTTINSGFVGGIVGSAHGTLTVTNSYFVGTVDNGGFLAGGIAGLFSGRDASLTITNSYFVGTLNGSGHAGGIVGYVDGRNMTITNSYSTGTVTGGGNVGGIVGHAEFRDFGSTITKCYSTCAIVSHGDCAGGIAGLVKRVRVIDCAALNPSVATNSLAIGRIVGGGELDSDLSNNIAYNGMTSTIDLELKGATQKDGIDIDSAMVYADATLGGRFTALDGWATINGFLPGLGTFVDIPDYIRTYINATRPTIITQPASVTLPYSGAGTTHRLTVEASVEGEGALTYQWYTNTRASNEGGSAIPGAMEAHYAAPVGAEGTHYYYVIVTSTIDDNGDGGRKVVSVASRVIALTVAVTNVQRPIITSQPSGGVVDVGTVRDLIVAAGSADDGKISYQWYANASASNIGGTPIDGATSAAYPAPTDAEGVYSYYVVVTNTIEDNGDGGLKSASVASNAVILSVGVAAINVQVPIIATQPASDVVVVDAYHNLTVLAAAAGGGTLDYQWYANSAASNAGGTPIEGATSAAYAVPTDAEGTFYYYVVVTNAIADNGDGGLKVAITASAVAIVKVSLYVAVLSPDRIIPKSSATAETAVLAPITAPPSNFSVGPNPAQRGVDVRFFYRGGRVRSGVLIIYDVSGNLVKKLKISNKPASGDSATPYIATWDLTDKKSRQVAAGTYLVRGVLSAHSGKRERVAAVVGVR